MDISKFIEFWKDWEATKISLFFCSDKGSGTVILNRSDYIKILLDIIS